MKALGIIAALILSAATAYAQPQTLLDGDFQSGGFAGLSAKGTRINSQWSALAGAEGAWVINHAFYIGGGGYATITEPTTEGLADTTMLRVGYGGGIIGYQFAPDNLVHIGVQTMVGAGGIGAHRSNWADAFDQGNQDSPDVFFVVEPAASVELNISKSFRLDVLASYRFVNGVETAGITNKSLSGPSVGVTARFGSF
ncbi:MAG: hypothetical protein JWQ98_19 [Chlorobi bacterium]|nr:hypothetical protein [Chlorobiota bacterium]